MTSEQRRAAIIRLLRTRDDHLPEPVRFSASPAGFVHVVTDERGREANTETCPDCLANDRVMFGCETCGGSGRVRSPRRRDPYATEAVLPFGFTVDRHEAVRARDAEIERLRRQVAPPGSEADLLAEANQHPYQWEIERRRMYRLFDYGLLDRALEQLRHMHDQAYRALHAVYVYGWMAEPDGPNVLLDVGLSFLSDRLPCPDHPDARLRRELRAPAEPEARLQLSAYGRAADARALEQRDDAIRAAIAAGEATSSVAASFGLSVSQVNRIVAKAAA